jgi:hypothetical protein
MNIDQLKKRSQDENACRTFFLNQSFEENVISARITVMNSFYALLM